MVNALGSNPSGATLVGSSPTFPTIKHFIRGNNMELKKMLVENRITQLRRKDPVRNAAIIRKNERILRKLNSQK